MAMSVLLTGWLVGSVPLAVLLGRMIGGAEHISAELQRPPHRLSSRYRAA